MNLAQEAGLLKGFVFAIRSGSFHTERLADGLEDMADRLSPPRGHVTEFEAIDPHGQPTTEMKIPRGAEITD